MYISLKNSKGFDADDIKTITSYLMSPRFRKQVETDYVNKHDSDLRLLYEINPLLYIVRHSEFYLANVDTAMHELHLSTFERYGLLDMYQLGTADNKSSILYWLLIPKSKYVQHTSTGLICKNSDSNNGEPALLARLDNLWIAGSKNSTVLALDLGSSHLIT